MTIAIPSCGLFFMGLRVSILARFSLKVDWRKIPNLYPKVNKIQNIPQREHRGHVFI